MNICIGGSQHGKHVQCNRDTFEVVLGTPVKPLRRLFEDSEIKLTMNPFQRIVAKLVGIPTSVQRPFEHTAYAREVYRLNSYVIFGRRVAAYVLEGIDPSNPQTVAEVELLTCNSFRKISEKFPDSD